MWCVGWNEQAGRVRGGIPCLTGIGRRIYAARQAGHAPMSRKWVPSSPALRLRYSGFLSATSSAASRYFICVSAATRAGGGEWAAAGGVQGVSAQACTGCKALLRAQRGGVDPAHTPIFTQRAAPLHSPCSDRQQARTCVAGAHSQGALQAHQVGLAPRPQGDVVLHARVVLTHKHVGVLC